MKKLLGIIVLGLFYFSSSFAESRLPDCEGEDYTKWKNCFGEYTKPYDSVFDITYKGEFGDKSGKWNGLGLYFITKKGKEIVRYEGQVIASDIIDGREFGFGIRTEVDGPKQISQKDIEGIGFSKTIYPEGDIYIGQTKRGQRHGKGFQTTMGSKKIGIYATFKDDSMIGNIPINEIDKFEETLLVFEAKLKASEECQSYGISIASFEFKKCSIKLLDSFILELNNKRLTEISNLKNNKRTKKQLFKDEDGKLTECISFTANGSCAYKIPYEIKPKKYSNNKFNAQKLIEQGIILLGNSNTTYSNSEPRLFYDSLSGKMRECEGKITMGNCYKYKFDTNYNYNSLFYNKENGQMQKCLNNVNGRCLKFRPQPSSPSHDQLFYDPRTKSMRTCLNSTNSGKCLAFGMAPSHRNLSKDTGAYLIDSPINPYYKKVPQSYNDLLKLGNRLMNSGCTLGINC